jgi:hypothetical protein
MLGMQERLVEAAGTIATTIVHYRGLIGERQVR